MAQCVLCASSSCCVMHHSYQLSLAEGRVQEHPIRLPSAWLGRATRVMFPLWLSHRETRAGGERKEEGTQKWSDREQAEPFLAVVPLLRGEPAVNGGVREALVDS